mgnify:FL=1
MNVVIMQKPNMVLRKKTAIEQLEIIKTNLLNLNYWPMWNKFANRILSEKRGMLSVNQRIDLHRVAAQQLVEDMWSIKAINHGQQPNFCQVILLWHGQKINGRTSALAIKNLEIDITIVHDKEGGIECSAWWEVSKLSRLLGFGNKLAIQITKQIFQDLTENGIHRFKDDFNEI